MKLSSLFYTVFLMLFAVPLCATTRGARPRKPLNPKMQRVFNNQLLIAVSARGTTVRGVEYLIEQGAEINCTDSEGNTPLQLAEKNNRSDLAKTLVRLGAERASEARPVLTPERQSFLNESLLRQCHGGGISKKDEKFAEVQYLLAEGAEANTWNDFGNALAFAAEDGLLKIAQLLIDNGADVNATVFRNGLKETALSRAVGFCQPKMVQLLIDAGADDTMIFDEKPLFYSVMEWQASYDHKKKEVVAKEYLAIAKQLIVAGACIDFIDPSSGKTLLDIARDKDQQEIVRLFTWINNFFENPSGTIDRFKNLGPDRKKEWFEMLLVQSIVRGREDLVSMLLQAAPEFELALRKHAFLFKNPLFWKEFFAFPEQEIKNIKPGDLLTIKMLIQQAVMRGREDLVEMLVGRCAFESHIKRYAYSLVAQRDGFSRAFKSNLVTLGALCSAKLDAVLQRQGINYGELKINSLVVPAIFHRLLIPNINSSAAHAVVHAPVLQDPRILADREIRAQQDRDYEEALAIDRAIAASLEDPAVQLAQPSAPVKSLVGNEESDTESDVEQTPSPERLREIQLRAIADRTEKNN